MTTIINGNSLAAGKTVDTYQSEIVMAVGSLREGEEVSVSQWAGQGPMAWITKEYGLDSRSIERLAALGWQIVQQSTKKRKVVSVLNVPDYTTEGQES
jgi:hypothetical protein